MAKKYKNNIHIVWQQKFTNFEVAYVVYEKEHNSLPLFIGFILTLKEPFAKRKDPEGESMRANFKIT